MNFSTQTLDNSRFGRSVLHNTGYVTKPILSNRCSYCRSNVPPEPTIALGPTLGVDRVAIEVPLIPSVSDPKLLLSAIKNTQLGRWGTRATARHSSTGAKIHFQFNRARWSITMEFNPSRFMDPDGTALIPADAVRRVVELLVQEYFSDGEALPAFAVTEEGQESLERWEDDWPEQIRVVRLDVSRDFVSNDSRFNVGLLSTRKARFARAVSIIHNQDGPSTWDSPKSRRSSAVKFYDKFKQAQKQKVKNLPPPGTFRFEYLMRSKHLRRAHIHTVADLNEAKIEAALRQGWDISGLGTPLVYPNGWIYQLLESPLSTQEKLETIGYLVANDQNAASWIPKSHREEIRRLAKRAGFSFRRPLAKQGKMFFHLDLEKGEIQLDKSV